MTDTENLPLLHDEPSDLETRVAAASDEGPGDTEVGDTEVGDTEVGDTEVGDAEVGDAEVGDAEVGDTEAAPVSDDETGDDEAGDDEAGVDARKPIPVEEWLEKVATMTQEIHRPEIVPSRSPNSLAKVPLMSSTTADQEPGSRRETRSDGHRNGSSHRDGGATGQPGAGDDRSRTASTGSTEIVGSFRPIVSAGPEGSGVHSGNRDGNVIIGIVRTLPDHELSRPTPVGAASGPPRIGRAVLLLMLVAALVGLGGGAGYWAARYIPERWTAEAEILLDTGLDQPDRYLATQQVLVQSSTVLDRALAELPVDRTYVEDDLKVFPIESGLALGITFVDQDPALARSVVQSVLASYMTEVEANAADTTSVVYRRRVEQLTEQRNLVEQRLASMEKANAEAESAELPLPYPGDVRRLATESDQLLGQIVALEESLLALEVGAVQRADAVVVTEPRVLAEPTWPKPLALAAIGMLAGAVLAALCLFLLSARQATALSVEAEGSP